MSEQDTTPTFIYREDISKLGDFYEARITRHTEFVEHMLEEIRCFLIGEDGTRTNPNIEGAMRRVADIRDSIEKLESIERPRFW